MSKNEIREPSKSAVNKQKTAQNTQKPAKNVNIKIKTKTHESSVVTVEDGVSKNVPTNTKETQHTAQNYKQVSRSKILFVSAMNYLIFFLGFCVCRHEPFARFHQNQALWMWIIVTILYLSFAFIPGVNRIAIPFVIMIHILWVIAGIGTALRGRAYAVPLVGKIKIVDWEKV